MSASAQARCDALRSAIVLEPELLSKCGLVSDGLQVGQCFVKCLDRLGLKLADKAGLTMVLVPVDGLQRFSWRQLLACSAAEEAIVLAIFADTKRTQTIAMEDIELYSIEEVTDSLYAGRHVTESGRVAFLSGNPCWR